MLSFEDVSSSNSLSLLLGDCLALSFEDVSSSNSLSLLLDDCLALRLAIASAERLRIRLLRFLLFGLGRNASRMAAMAVRLEKMLSVIISTSAAAKNPSGGFFGRLISMILMAAKKVEA